MLFVNEECQKVALVGLGGIGKTQVALEFAYAVKDVLPDYSVFWIPALSMESFEQACAEIVRTLGIAQAPEDKEDAKELLRRHLSTETGGRWLLIVDNADDMEIVTGSEQVRGIADYLPHSEEGLLIFTTRTQEAAVALAGRYVIELERMSQQEAVELLKSLIRKDLLIDDSATTQLLDELTYLPLAIAQAAAYLNTNKIPISEYLRLLRNTEQDMVSLLSREFYDGTRYRGSNNAVATTWMVSFIQIFKNDPAAADLLLFMSCIEPKAIPRSILPSLELEEQMVHAIGTLCAYAFVVRRADEETYDLHRLVHMATRAWLSEHNLAAEVTEMAIRHVAKVFPSNDWENRGLWKAYLPHALRLLEAKGEEEVVERYDLCFLVGHCLRVDGRVGESVKWLEESVRGRRSLFEADNLGILNSQYELAIAYQAHGQAGRAVELLEDGVAIRKKVQEKEHLDQLALQHALAMAYYANGQVTKAIELLEHVVSVQEKVLPEEDSKRLGGQHMLAGLYREDGQVGKAIELLEHVIAVREKVLPEEHINRLASQGTLAGAYLVDGQVGKAIKLLEHVVAIQEEVLPEEHQHRLMSQQTLARAYHEDGQVGKAMKLLEYVVSVQEKVLIEEHTDRLASQHYLAVVYEADGQVGKAVELLEYVVAVREKVQAEEHPARLASQYMLVKAYQANGQEGKAMELLEHVMAMHARVLKDDHPSQLVWQNTLVAIVRFGLVWLRLNSLELGWAGLVWYVLGDFVLDWIGLGWFGSVCFWFVWFELLRFFSDFV
jgi:tetratricopeptide (TPR) repeat protein